MRTIFISYSRADDAFAEGIYADLSACGDSPWRDLDLVGGKAWWAGILRRIRESDIFLCVLTSASLDSTACRRELSYAVSLGKTIVPVSVHPDFPASSLPVSLASLHLVSYFGGERDALASLYKAIRQAPASPPLPQELPPEPPIPLSYMSELREQVTSDRALGLDEQIALVGKLRQASREANNHKDLQDLVERFLRRRDLYAVVSVDLEGLASSTGVGQGGAANVDTVAAPAADQRPSLPSSRASSETKLRGLWLWLWLCLIGSIENASTQYLLRDVFRVDWGVSASFSAWALSFSTWAFIGVWGYRRYIEPRLSALTP